MRIDLSLRAFTPSVRFILRASWAAAVLTLAACTTPASVDSQGAVASSSREGIALDTQTLDLIQEATFEVVVKKPVNDSLKYEKPLPLHLLPYTVRNDKYYSVGTAFAIAPNRFVSAAHVLNLGMASQYEGFALRDRNGNVYPIDQILRYSSRRDFAVFSIANRVARRVLQPNTHPRLNEKVYAVGNALGQGVVIRDGLYTSSTPEERDGAWKWIRFSAAASPGNSGGPLLDRDGKLIGIVERKSQNENLNFALPIAEVLNARDHLGVVDTQVIYRIDNMPMTKTAVYRHEIALPKRYDELNRELVRLNDQDGTRLMAATFKENRKDIFPNGKGSTTLLHSNNFSTYFPGEIAMGDDGNWDIYKPKKIARAELGANGYLTTGDLGSFTYFHLRLPDTAAQREVSGDSRQLMDLFLKGANYTRTVGPEVIKIVSMGKAHDEAMFTDSYQRKWLVKTWLIEFSDQKLVMLALPVPGGFVGMLRIADTGQIVDYRRDMKALADFTYISYYGTLAQWQAYLGMKDILPAAFSDIRIGFEPDKEFRYQSRRVSFAVPASLMKVTKNSDLQLGFSYFPDGGKTVWDVSKVVAGEDKNNNVAFTIIRTTKPTLDMSDDDRKGWDALTNRKHPFDRVSYFNDDQTIIGTVFSGQADPHTLSSAPVLYAVMHSADGVVQQITAAAQLDSFLRGFEVRENVKAAGRGGAGKIAANQ